MKEGTSNDQEQMKGVKEDEGVEKDKTLDILKNPVKPRVATVNSSKRKSNKDREGIETAKHTPQRTSCS
eukprot:gnl/Chilomastix_caulleri/8574.p1 GENE.gnl/Chilomastix_caulleri/8574~~gnl/Chilomastix_caulleri/8574.p1  ORF type:complete len:69 (-),score=19.80 gnl/Chilomastix_caulleri/8574:122-328(-)